MTQRVITAARRIADVLEEVPGAVDVFSRHGVDPRASCGAQTHHIHLRDAARCGLVDLDGLIEELRTAAS